MLKWLMNNPDDPKQTPPAQSSVTPTPVAPVSTPSDTTPPPVVSPPSSKVTFVQTPGQPEDSSATPPADSPAPAIPMDAPTPPQEEKKGTIEVSEGIPNQDIEEKTHAADLFTEALEANTTPNPEEKPVDMPKPEEKQDKPEAPKGKDDKASQKNKSENKMSVEEIKPTDSQDQGMDAFLNSSPSTPSPSPSSGVSLNGNGGPGLPDVSSEIKRLLQERWISLAQQELEQLAKRKEEISTQLAEVEVQQRELTSKKQTLESERVEILHAHDSWSAKMKEAQTTLDKVVQEVASV
jgi:hypothetical protein